MWVLEYQGESAENFYCDDFLLLKPQVIPECLDSPKVADSEESNTFCFCVIGRSETLGGFETISLEPYGIILALWKLPLVELLKLPFSKVNIINFSNCSFCGLQNFSFLGFARYSSVSIPFSKRIIYILWEDYHHLDIIVQNTVRLTPFLFLIFLFYFIWKPGIPGPCLIRSRQVLFCWTLLSS